MIRRGYIAKFVMMVVCLWTATAVAAGSDEAVSDSGTTGQPPAVEDVTEEQTFEEPHEQPLQDMEIETHRIAEASVGYRFVGTRDSGVRAAEYDYLHSSFAGGAHLAHLGKDLKLDVEGVFLNTKDYHANFMADYGGYYRLTVRSESLFHNLDHETSDLVIFKDIDPSDRYGITTRQDTIQFRYKLHDYPIHLNLSHWLIDREGKQQLRYADFSFEDYYFGSKSSQLYSTSRTVNRLSHEGTAGFDAHLGPINVVYSFLFRQFDDGKSTPNHEYNVLSIGRAAHNEDPESRYYSHTVKLYTSPAGGITGAASYSYGKRENLSALTTVIGADKAKDTIQNAAGDFTYSPCAWFTAALKYRHLEIDRDTPSTLFVSSLSPATLDIRQGIDTRKDTVSASLTIRPNMLMSINGEYQGVFQHRSNTGTDPDTMWNLPEDSDTHKGILTVLFRPFKGLRFRGLYEYTTTNNPLYDSDPEQKHEGRLLVTYTNSSRWGASANYRIASEWNDHISRTTHPLDGSEGLMYVLPRDRNFVHASVGFWVSPIDRLTVSGNFGYLRTRAEQAVLFATVFNGMNAATEYISQGEIYSANAAYRASEKLDLSLAYQLVHSRSTFKPDSPTSNGTSTAGISELSRIKTLEQSLSARADYQVTKRFGCALDYTYRAYDNRLSSEGEGAVHVVTALLKTTW